MSVYVNVYCTFMNIFFVGGGGGVSAGVGVGSNSNLSLDTWIKL